MNVPELAQDPPTDEAMLLIKGRQWVDLREVRLLDETDSAHRVVVDGLAGRLLQIAESIEEPSAAPVVPSASTGAESASSGGASMVPGEMVRRCGPTTSWGSRPAAAPAICTRASRRFVAACAKRWKIYASTSGFREQGEGPAIAAGSPRCCAESPGWPVRRLQARRLTEIG